MRRTITLAATLVLVVGGLAALATVTAPVAADTTAVDAQTDDDTLRVSDYEVRDRTIGPDEALELNATYRGTGDDRVTTALHASIDGEEEQIGRATVDPGDGQVEVAAASDGWEFSCEFGYNDDDGWYVRCEVTYDTANLGPGDHDLGLGDAEPTTVSVQERSAGGDDASLPVTSYDVVDRTLSGDQHLEVVASYEVPDGEPPSTVLQATVDGEEETLGTLAVDRERGNVEFDPTEQGESIVVTVDCEWVDDGHLPYLDCETIELDPDVLFLNGGEDGGQDDAAEGVHEVGLGDATPITVASIDRADEDKKVDKRGLVSVDVADDELAPGEHVELRATYAGTEGGTVARPIVGTVDGEEQELGTVRVDPDAETVQFEPEDAAAAADWEVRCEFGYSDDDGWYVTCEITYETADLAPGDHDVGLQGHEPAAVSLARAEYDDLTMVRGAVQNRSVDAGESLHAEARYEGAGDAPASADLVVTVDGETKTLGTAVVDPANESVSFQANDTPGGVWYQQRRTAATGSDEAAAADWEVHCEFGYDDEDGWYLTCEITYDTAELQPGDHDVSVGDAAASTVTVEEPGDDGLFGGVVEWVGDLLGI